MPSARRGDPAWRMKALSPPSTRPPTSTLLKNQRRCGTDSACRARRVSFQLRPPTGPSMPKATRQPCCSGYASRSVAAKPASLFCRRRWQTRRGNARRARGSLNSQASPPIRPWPCPTTSPPPPTPSAATAHAFVAPAKRKSFHPRRPATESVSLALPVSSVKAERVAGRMQTLVMPARLSPQRLRAGGTGNAAVALEVGSCQVILRPRSGSMGMRRVEMMLEVGRRVVELWAAVPLRSRLAAP